MKLLNLLPKKTRLMTMSLGLLASATLLSSCLKNDSEEGFNQPAASLNFINAATSQQTVGVYVNGRVLFGGQALKFNESPGYLLAGEGTHLVQTTVGGRTEKLSDLSITLKSGEYYSVIIADNGIADSLTTIFTRDSLEVSQGKAKVRFVQASPGPDAYDLAVQGGPTLFQNQLYLKHTSFTQIDPGKYKFAVRLASAIEDKAVTEEVDVKEGQIYTIVVGGTATGTGTQALKAFAVLARKAAR